MIVGSGRCGSTAKRGRYLIRLYVYFCGPMSFCLSNLRKLVFLRTVGNGGIEMVASQNFLKGAFFNFYKKGADAVY